MFHVNDRVILALSDDADVFEGLVDTWEAQTSINAPTHASALDGLIATVIQEIDSDGMVDIRLENGVEFTCEPSELTLVREIVIKGYND